MTFKYSVMGRNALINNTQTAEFARKDIPRELSWKPAPDGDDPIGALYNLGPKDYPIHISFFKQSDLWLPLWHLLVDFLRCTHLKLCQLSPNVIRIIGGINALNKNHGTDLGLEELKFCYSLSKCQYGYSLSTRNDAPSLCHSQFA